jgi:hypothetical protein
MWYIQAGYLSDNNIANFRPPPTRFLNRLFLINKLPPPSPNIHILQRHPLGLVPEFIHDNEEYEDGEEDVVDDKVIGTERVQEASIPLEKHEEDVQGEREVGTPWIECGAERQLRRVLSLCDEGFAEANVGDADYGPDEEGCNCWLLV